MNCRRWNLLPVLALLSAGCVTAKYRYSVEVPGGECAIAGDGAGELEGGQPDVRRIERSSHRRPKAHQTMQTMFCVFMDVPRRIEGACDAGWI